MSSKDRLAIRATFPFAPFLDRTPPVSVVLTNVLFSVASVVGALGSVLVTAGVFLPLSLVASTVRMVRAMRNPPSIEKRVILISGASQGIGKALALQYAKENQILILLGRSKSLSLCLVWYTKEVTKDDTTERLAEVVEEVMDLGCTIVDVIEQDIGVEDVNREMKELIARLKQMYGRIDLVISNAGTAGFFEDIRQNRENGFGLEIVSNITRVNVNGNVALIMAAWEMMRDEQGYGQIAVTCSSTALFGPVSFCTYNATKAYIYHFVQSLRIISLQYNIDVTCICPGMIESGQTHAMIASGAIMPIAALADPNQMAARIVKAVQRKEGVCLWPLNQTLPLAAAKAINPLCEELGRWAGTASGLVTTLIRWKSLADQAVQGVLRERARRRDFEEDYAFCDTTASK